MNGIVKTVFLDNMALGQALRNEWGHKGSISSNLWPSYIHGL